MPDLRQSTAVTIKFGPGLDKTNGVDPESGLATAMNTGIKLSKNGGAKASRNSSTAPTHDSDGDYNVHLDTTDTGTAGILRVSYADPSTNLYIKETYHVLTQAAYDAKYSTGYVNAQVKGMDPDVVNGSALATSAVAELQGGLPYQIVELLYGAGLYLLRENGNTIQLVRKSDSVVMWTVPRVRSLVPLNPVTQLGA